LIDIGARIDRVPFIGQTFRLAAPSRIDAQINHDSIKPGCKQCPARIEAVNLGPTPHKGFLYQILSHRGIPYDPSCDTQSIRAVSDDQLIESGAITRRAKLDQLFIRRLFEALQSIHVQLESAARLSAGRPKS